MDTCLYKKSLIKKYLTPGIQIGEIRLSASEAGSPLVVPGKQVLGGWLLRESTKAALLIHIIILL